MYSTGKSKDSRLSRSRSSGRMKSYEGLGSGLGIPSIRSMIGMPGGMPMRRSSRRSAAAPGMLSREQRGPDQIGLGDEADQGAVRLHHRQTADLMLQHQLRRLAQRGARPHRDRIAGHHLRDLDRAEKGPPVLGAEVEH